MSTKGRLLLLKALVLLGGLYPLVRLVLLDLTGQLGANPVQFVLHSTGLWSVVYLWAALAVSPLRDWLQWPLVMGVRRMLGLFAFFYALLHFVAYAWLDQLLDWRFIWQEITGHLFLAIGTLALLLLLPLAVTSTNRWMRRLGKRWQRLHTLVYPTAVLTALHFFLSVKEDITEPLIYAVILGLLLGHRFFRKQRRI